MHLTNHRPWRRFLHLHKNRRANSKAKTPPPQKPPPNTKKTNGVTKNSLPPKSTKDNGPKVPKDPKLYDLHADAECRLCDKKNSKPGSDALLKHYALEHFKVWGCFGFSSVSRKCYSYYEQYCTELKIVHSKMGWEKTTLQHKRGTNINYQLH